MVRKIVRSYLIFNVLFNLAFSFHFATFVLFLRRNDMSITQIGFINFAFMIAVFLSEIPTGVVADRFGRKVSVVLGTFVASLGFLFYFLSNGFWQFILSESTIALGSSLISGALDAWIKDSLDLNGYKKDIGVIFSWGDIAIKGASLAGGVVGGIIAVGNIRLPWLMSSIGLVICGIVALKIIREDYFTDKKTSMMDICRQSVRYGYKNKQIWTLILIGSLLMFFFQPLNMQWSILFDQAYGIGVLWLVWTGIRVFEMVGIFIAGKLMNRGFDRARIMSFSIILTGAAIVLASIVPYAGLTLFAFWIHESGRGFFAPTQKAYLHDNIPSDKRATIGSFNSMIAKLGAAAGWLGGGLLAEVIGIKPCWLLAGILLFVVLPLVGKLKNKSNRAI